ncbi:class I SAM-dependent methyltransferase [bacterium AH-315-F03]|nr:class I SAM-dependent methyltransferase [bacterium AH-315-F03]
MVITKSSSKQSNNKSKKKASRKQTASSWQTYQKFARVYDMLSADEHSLKMVPYTQRIFRRFRFSGSVGLDLCCGTGSAALALSDAGYRMTGVDGSKMMLKNARAKPRWGNHPTTFLHGILPELAESPRLRRPEQFDFVVSYYDSLNYLHTEAALQGAFATVAKLMRPAGLFIFDMNTNQALKTLWGTQVFADERDDIAWIWKNQYNPQKNMASARVIFFERQAKSDNWRRFEETHTERAYNIGTVRKLLRESGFDCKAAYRCFTFVTAKEKDDRICFVARRS